MELRRTVITREMLAIVRERAVSLHKITGQGQGHGPDHILRVERMALDFLDDKSSDKSLCSLIALLHDADDPKLFPENKSGGTPNADRIMAAAGIPDSVQTVVRREIGAFGYSKRVQGKAPWTPEGKAASDADMCDIMGATGILRLAEYDAARHVPFFDPDDVPDKNIPPEQYLASQDVGAVRHMFDKILKLPGFMLTGRGLAEALVRQQVNIMFLRALFQEQDAARWNALLEEAVENNIEGG